MAQDGPAELLDEGQLATLGPKNERRATAVYRVKFTVVQDGPGQAIDGAGVPLRGDLYVAGNDVAAGVFLQTKSARREAPQLNSFLVTCNYSSLPDEDDDRDKDGKPVDDPLLVPRRVFPGNTTREEIAKDGIYRGCFDNGGIDVGDPAAWGPGERNQRRQVTNTAGFNFDPEPSILGTFQTYRVVDRYRQWDSAWGDNVGKINSDAVTIRAEDAELVHVYGPFPAKTLLWYAGEAEALDRFVNDQRRVYFDRIVTLHYNPDGWTREILNNGWNAVAREGGPDGVGGIIPAGGIAAGKVRGMAPSDFLGQTVTTPFLLDVDGDAIAGSDRAKAVYVRYDLETEIAMQPLFPDP